MENERYGKLIVQEILPIKGIGRLAKCLCDCGNTTVTYLHALKKNKVKSCGCWRSEVRKTFITHGKSRTLIYKRWVNMIQRCTNPNNPKYPSYGGRGIEVCERWLKFENFYADMGECPEDRSLDRINNNKGYSPENCRWATRSQQAMNRRF